MFPFRRFIVLAVLLVMVASPLLAVTAQQPEEGLTAFDMLAAMNEWRLEQGLWPFKPNATLEALARLQLEYILALPNIPPNIHDGILGEGPRDRARWEPYAWPYYGIPERTSLEEITVAQHTVQDGITWWQNSPIHNAAATNPNYREIGVAALPYEYGMVYVAVMGGRPNVFPALIHPDGNTLYLTRETYSGVMEGHLSKINEVRLLNSDQTPLTDWQAWQPTLPMPGPDLISGDTFYVEYSNGDQTVTTPVSLQEDVFPLPDYVDALRPPSDQTATAAVSDSQPPTGANVAVIAADERLLALRVDNTEPLYLSEFRFMSLWLDPASPLTSFTALAGSRYAGPGACFVFTPQGDTLTLPDACTGPVTVNQIQPEQIFWWEQDSGQPIHFFVLDDNGRRLADCPDGATDCAFFVDAGPADAGGAGGPPISREVELLYDNTTFTLLNRGGQNLDISGLMFSGADATFSALSWDTTASNGAIWVFPAEACFQLVDFSVGSPRTPGVCGSRYGWLTAQPDEQFWAGETFQVRYDGKAIAECNADKGSCVFELP